MKLTRWSLEDPLLEEEKVSYGRDPLLEERKIKHMLLNRKSVRRSRMRKQKQIEDLTKEAGRLKSENGHLKQNIKATEDACAKMEEQTMSSTTRGIESFRWRRSTTQGEEEKAHAVEPRIHETIENEETETD
ncbi:hypothetical protein RYX36_029048 [Vicia faba]